MPSFDWDKPRCVGMSHHKCSQSASTQSNYSNFTFKKTCQKSSNKMAISLRQAALRKKIRHKIPLVLLHWLPEPLWAKLLGEGHGGQRETAWNWGAFCNDLPAAKHIIPSRPPVLQVALGERDRASPESSPTMDDRKVKACRLNKFLNKLKKSCATLPLATNSIALRGHTAKPSLGHPQHAEQNWTRILGLALEMLCCYASSKYAYIY